MAEWLAHSIGSECADQLLQGSLPHVSAERTLPQCLFPVRLHPRHASLEEEFHMWARSFLGSSAKDIEQMQRRGIASLPCYLWPTTDPQRSLTLIKLLHWFTLVDEAVDEGAGLRGEVLEVERLCKGLIQALQLGSLITPCSMQQTSSSHSDDPPLLVLHEPAQQRVVTVGRQWWGEPHQTRARLAAEVSRYLMAQVDVTRFRKDMLESRWMLRPGVEQYIISRRVASAFPLGLAMVEYGMGDRILELDEETLNSPILQQLRDAVSDQASWLNDIISFPKEFRQGDFLSLLPLLHIRNNAHLPDPASDDVVPFRVAVVQAWEMVAARERDCARLAHQILHSPHLAGKPGLEEYVETVCGFTSGNWAWSLECPAYIHFAQATDGEKMAMPGYARPPDLQAATTTTLTHKHGRGPLASNIISPLASAPKMEIVGLGSAAAGAKASLGHLGLKPSARTIYCFSMSSGGRQQLAAPTTTNMKTGISSRAAPLHVPSLLLAV